MLGLGRVSIIARGWSEFSKLWMPPGEQLSAQLQLVVGRHRLLDQQLLDGVDEYGLFYRRHVRVSETSVVEIVHAISDVTFGRDVTTRRGL